MQNANDRAAIAARLDAITADFCQLHLDCRGREESEEERAEMDKLEAEMHRLSQQLRDTEWQDEQSAAPDEEPAPAPAPAPAPENPDAYNGWKNYETWCVHLWLSNDAYTDATAREIVAAAWTNAADEVAADREAIVAPHADAADALRDWLRDEENPLAETSNVYTDLLGHALGRVDWYEVAEAFQPDPLPSIEPAPDDDDDEEQEEQEEQEEPEADWRQWTRERDD